MGESSANGLQPRRLSNLPGSARWLESAQRQRVETYEERRAQHHARSQRRAHHDPPVPQRASRDWQRAHVEDKRPQEVELDRLESVTREHEEGGEIAEVRTHEDDVGSLHGHVVPCSDSNADVGGGQRRRVVHAVSNHSDHLVLFALAALGAKSLDRADLVCRKSLRHDTRLVYAALARHATGSHPVVPAAHPDLRPRHLQRRHARARVRRQLVLQRHRREGHALHSEGHHRGACGPHGRRPLEERGAHAGGGSTA
mmetsp:Transcript_37774/g.106130  ORF Transcript_37774/g.106130 Transcript_37774/m.106130 type:complete len:256 (+) Transcript_37774:423-1190(+)